MENTEDFLEDARHEGKAVLGEETKDKVYSSEQTFPDRPTAEREFAHSVSKLFNVDAWSDLPGITSTFELYDQKGVRKAKGQPEVGDHIRIVLPGPFPENWVEIIHLLSTEQLAEFTARPSVDPTPQKADGDAQVKHFFSKDATSTFRVTLKETTVQAFEIGKEERINNQGEEAGNRALVNTVVALGGWSGFQALQWNKLTDYLVHLL